SIARTFGMSVDSLRDAIKPSLLPSTTAQAGSHFAVVALANGTYELRDVHLGANDLEWAEIADGIKEGGRVVLFGDASAIQRPPGPPRLVRAESVRQPARTAAVSER